MVTVAKKITTEWFDMILAGKKKFELRLANFDIAEGDTLRLEEWTGIGDDRRPTGRFLEKMVTYARLVDIKAWTEKQPDLADKGFWVIQFE